MDTESFLLRRESITLRLDDHRRAVTHAQHEAGSVIPGFQLPIWARFAVSAALPKLVGGFWPKLFMAAAPLALSFWKSSRSSQSPYLSFLPLVKSLINRYNPR